ncbi:MAG TPA: hypothetical protein VMT89_11505 [Candidatus Acidoferrales bacterium]|nr:hypothetical protein [Candidatus Acidoferrales bacterium]
MRLVEALDFPGTADQSSAATERTIPQRLLTGASLIVGLAMLMGLLVSVPVLP